MGLCVNDKQIILNLPHLSLAILVSILKPQEKIMDLITFEVFGDIIEEPVVDKLFIELLFCF